MLTQYYQETDVTVCWDSLNNWVSVYWRNSPSKEAVKKGCDAILKLLTSKKASLVFNDNSKITGAWGASSWVAEEWFPRMIAAGLRKFAWIESTTSALSIISAKRSATRNEGGVIRLFNDGSEAEKWLRG
ncbi:hypothetical protein [Geotalea uraniireducens]|uniref:STAS/SEC14 domain-containing protein n=1 Tax=Geotalea uraniireducens (strain Rf4) TaxID=351605 RepID=A5G9L8_GEOUR|nr:hypothetical protein [Geotalea uraniireducens]ABQ28486.1 hypothetical protein Gura_4343 [Geotalea uraniireducens Rf4]